MIKGFYRRECASFTDHFCPPQSIIETEQHGLAVRGMQVIRSSRLTCLILGLLEAQERIRLHFLIYSAGRQCDIIIASFALLRISWVYKQSRRIKRFESTNNQDISHFRVCKSPNLASQTCKSKMRVYWKGTSLQVKWRSISGNKLLYSPPLLISLVLCGSPEIWCSRESLWVHRPSPKSCRCPPLLEWRFLDMRVSKRVSFKRDIVAWIWKLDNQGSMPLLFLQGARERQTQPRMVWVS